VREPSKQENSRDLGARRFAPVFYVMAKAMIRKAKAKAKAMAPLRAWGMRNAPLQVVR
jgi:hypothetical protein